MVNFKIAETEYFSQQMKLIGKNLNTKVSNYVYPQLRENPFYGLNIKKLKGDFSEIYRYRIGDYRLFYSIDTKNKIVILVSINQRKEAYKKKK